MAGASAPGRKRSGPPGPRPGPLPIPGHPPSKRARSFPEAAAAAPDPEDPFGEHGDFTADDLEELDILASQALSQCPPAPREVTSIHKVPRLDGLSKNPAGKNSESVPVDNFELEVLQAQYRELQEKLKSMEEKVLLKNGEIKILRDSLQQTECTLEEQRRSHFLLEQEKAQALSDKEKEFSRKLQSLQSELQFKDAEMNELRTKLQSSERSHRLAAPSTGHVSPRKNPSVVIKQEVCSPQFGKTSFPTKESFSANVSLLHPCQTEPGHQALQGREVSDKTHSMRNEPVREEVTQQTLLDSWIQRPSPPGSILINLLLKQPLVPGFSLSLCHLLSNCAEGPIGPLLQPAGHSASAGISDSRIMGSRDGSPSLSALREAQSLALTGLNLVARNEGSCDGDPAHEGGRTFPLGRLLGAVHLLPLVQFFIGWHCQALHDLAAAKRSGGPGNSPTHAPGMSSRVEASPEDTVCNLEDFSVASLCVLQHLVCHSGAVVCMLLSGVGADPAAGEGSGALGSVHSLGVAASASRAAAADQGQHPLLKMILDLLALSSSTGHLQMAVLSQCLKVLVKLAENAASHFLPRFQSVLRVLPQSLSPDTPLTCMLLTVRLLALLVDDDTLAPRLCSHSEGCLLLLLYMYITSRPDPTASNSQWLQLEQEAVWLLAKLGVQSLSPPVTGSDCQCSVEVVRALTVMLHRQWLTLRRAEAVPRTAQQRRTVRCLRDTVLLLHSLSQKDKLFTMHCVEVLHQYDQVMPGVSTLIRGLPDVTDCEEAALDDLCVTETELEDHEADCS